MCQCVPAEIVPARLRTFIYAFDRSFEMAVAACAAPVVGKLAESVFGFEVHSCSLSFAWLIVMRRRLGHCIQLCKMHGLDLFGAPPKQCRER